MKINILGVEIEASDKVLHASPETSKEYINAMKKHEPNCICNTIDEPKNYLQIELDKVFCSCKTINNMNNDLKNFLEEEKLILLNRISMYEQFRISMDEYIKDHDTRLINKVLEIVKSEVEKKLEKWDESAQELEDGWGNYTVFLPWELKYNKKDISTIIDNLKVK